MVHVDGICDPRHEPPFVCLWLFDRLCLSVTVFVFVQLFACAQHHKCRAEAKHWPVWPKRTTPTVINTSEIAAAGDRHGRSCGRKLICCRLNARIFVDRMVMLRLGHVCYFREQLTESVGHFREQDSRLTFASLHIVCSKITSIALWLYDESGSRILLSLPPWLDTSTNKIIYNLRQKNKAR